MQKGFTLIELIIVIVILGILAVTAAPRFIDIADDANEATTQFEAANFKAGVKLIYSAYQIRQESPIVVGDKSVPIDPTSNWPTGNGSGSNICVSLWDSVLNSSESVTAISNLSQNLSSGWNAYGFGNGSLCAYGKQYSNLSFASGNLPHFVYYIRDFGPFSVNGQTYEGRAGEVQLVNM